jgi:hypothetical protein
MKYFIIEIVKPSKFINNYQEAMMEKINNSDFEVVKVCSSLEESEKESIKFIRKNIKNQSGLHYEIIQGDGTEGYNGLKSEIENFYSIIKNK